MQIVKTYQRLNKTAQKFLFTFKMQTASMTNLTPLGGLFMDLTTVISAAVSVFRAARAASRIGIASARLASQSSLIAWAARACSLATASSALTMVSTCTKLYRRFN